MLWTIQAAGTAITNGDLSPLALLESCLHQIDKYEPRVRAWVMVDRERARRQAELLTMELKQGRCRGPLHGIPLGIKDIIDVFDWPTACGSQLWKGSMARRDATVVARLRATGAILLGKTVTTAYASFDPPPTRNPWNIERTPGGSSSGSAAAVACGMCLGALGSQTGGSITRPASYCGAGGCKPSLGRVSVYGVLPLAPSMDHVGAMAATVRDMAILLQAIGGPDAYDPACSGRPMPNLLARLEQPAAPPRLGRPRGLFEDKAEPSVQDMMDRVSDQFRTSGGVVNDLASPAGMTEVLECHRIVMAVEAAAYHGERLARHPEDYPPWIRGLLEEGLACPAVEYARCKKHQEELKREMLDCFEGYDALLTPATTSPAPVAASTGNPAFNSPWSYTGLPTVSLPAEFSKEGLPLAIQLIGRPWSEADLFAAAAWCEQTLAFTRREPPV
jgi:aspartyl-tRNA(Asn)/glutamyl-tRNA(Gln) amidotransferase subunit A